MKQKIYTIIKNNVVQSVLFGGLIALSFIFIWDVPVEKYNLEADPFERLSSSNTYWLMADFDHDGNSEYARIHKGEHIGDAIAIVTYNEAGNIFSAYQINHAHWSFHLQPASYDIDGDNYDEILFFSVRNDSIFFNAYSIKNNRALIANHFIAEFERKRNNYAYKSKFAAFGDFDKNGTNELFFEFNAGFGQQPRGIFKIDFPSLKISKSPTEYMTLQFSSFADLNNDHIPEILASCSAPSNVSTYKKYTDTISYITVLDYNLNPQFSPLPQGGPYSSVTCIPSFKHDSVFYALARNRGVSENEIKIITVNSKGKVIKQKKWNKLPEQIIESVELYEIDSVPFINFNKRGKYQLTPNLEKIPDSLAKINNRYHSFELVYDLNADGYDELININNDIIEVYNKREKVVSSLSPPIKTAYYRFYPVFANNKITKHMVTSISGFFYISYNRNKNYYIVYVFYFLIFLIGTFLVWILLFFQRKNLQQKWQTEKQLQELQFNAVKNQLNPHFLYNALNSVAWLINNDQKADAYNFLTVNSRMIQQVMEDSNEVKRSLKDEIRFTQDYLDIQMHRFKNKFQTRIFIHPEVDLNFKVPKMCIHTYAENAVKHGFRNTTKHGLLEIKIEPEKEGIKITVSDNGMGRKVAADYKDSTGNGLKIMHDYYRLFEKYHNYLIREQIIDLPSKQLNQTGTKVELRILHKEKKPHGNRK